MIEIPKSAEKVIRKQIFSEYSREDALKVFALFQEWYEKLEKDQPFIGGKKNFLWEQVYTAIALFAYYEATDREKTPEEIGDLCTQALMGNNLTMGKIFNFNWKWFQNIYAWMYKALKQQADKHKADGSWNNTWGVELNPEGRKEGVSVRLTGCPVYDFAKKHGYEKLMPALCKSDYKVFEPFHCKMIRYYTVADGDDYCDFWQVGDKSEAWKNADKSRLK